jgi:hypothetical protein
MTISLRVLFPAVCLSKNFASALEQTKTEIWPWRQDKENKGEHGSVFLLWVTLLRCQDADFMASNGGMINE